MVTGKLFPTTSSRWIASITSIVILLGLMEEEEAPAWATTDIEFVDPVCTTPAFQGCIVLSVINNLPRTLASLA